MRTYTRIDDETAAAMSDELESGMTMTVIAAHHGLGYSSADYAIKRWRKAHPGWEVAADIQLESLRTRILDALATGQTFNTVTDLSRMVANGSPVGDHEVMHILYSLGRQHLVTFQEHRKGNHKDLTLIHEPAKAVGTSRQVTKTKHFEAAIAVETSQPLGSEVVEEVPVAFIPSGRPEPEPPQLVDTGDRFPLINALVARETRLRQAAELLEAAGADELALSVLDKVEDLTPLEREVIQYFSEQP